MCWKCLSGVQSEHQIVEERDLKDNVVVGARRVSLTFSQTADLLGFSHRHNKGLQRVFTNWENTQWAAFVWRITPCWCQGSELLPLPRHCLLFALSLTGHHGTLSTSSEFQKYTTCSTVTGYIVVIGFSFVKYCKNGLEREDISITVSSYWHSTTFEITDRGYESLGSTWVKMTCFITVFPLFSEHQKTKMHSRWN